MEAFSHFKSSVNTKYVTKQLKILNDSISTFELAQVFPKVLHMNMF